ncbi:MAG: hypothetical protein PHE88_11635 [Elusimicrobia bacterium]|nr:hypothetical protein [Elusimicrobiota bacterium]
MDNGLPSIDELMSGEYLNKREITIPEGNLLTLEQITQYSLSRLKENLNTDQPRNA